MIDIIGAAVEDIEQRLPTKERLNLKLEKELSKAELAVKKGDLESMGEAVRRYSGVLSFGPEYKKIFAGDPAKRESIAARLKEVRDIWYKMKFPNGPGN